MFRPYDVGTTFLFLRITFYCSYVIWPYDLDFCLWTSVVHGGSCAQLAVSQWPSGNMPDCGV